MQLGNKMIFIKYNSPIKTGETMKITLRLSNSFGFANDLKVMFNRYGEAPGGEKNCYLVYNEIFSTPTKSVFEGEVIFDSPGYRTFYIELKLNNQTKKIEYNNQTEELVIVDSFEFNFFEQFVYLASFKTPNWVKGGIMYQIYVDTFCAKDIPEHLKEKVVSWETYPKWRADEDGEYRNNQWYGGNLKGIIAKLPYIKSLGVTVIYLTPVFKSPSSNRYDIEDYEEIDELVGTWEDYEKLSQKANKMGIKLVQDQVFNHSSSENPLLKENPDMYDWEIPYSKPKCWWGYENLVEFNKYHNRYFEYFTKITIMYLKYMNGFRFDVADNLPDHVLKYFRNISNGAYLLGEVWKNAITGEYRGFLEGDELDGVMNYQFGNSIHRYVRWGNPKNYKDIVENICNLYPPEALDVSPIFLSSHDTPRIPNILVGNFMKESLEFENVWDMEKSQYWYDGDRFNTEKFRKWEFDNDFIPKEKQELAIKLQKIAVFLQYTLPGLPSIFAGDEVGATGYKDPFNRKPFPSKINKDIYEFYVKMGEIRIQNRKTFSVSKNFKIFEISDKKLIYKRGRFLFIVNRSPHEIFIKHNLKKSVFVVSTEEVKKRHVLPAYSAVVIKF